MPLSRSSFSQPASGRSGSRILRRALLVALPAALAAVPLPSFALFGDRVELFAAENVTWDSNVFRLPEELGPVTDWYYTTSLGVNATVPYSLQKFVAQFTYFATRYHKTTELDFNGHTAHLGWIWALTPRATGEIAYDDTRTLASFAQFVAGSERTRDVLDSRIFYGNGAWYVVPSWRVHAAAGLAEQTHSDPTRQLNDLRTGSGEVGLSYETAQQNRIGVAARAERGESIHTNTALGEPDFSYRQAGGGVVVHYALTAHSMLDGRVEYTRRDYDNDAFRSFGGPTLRFQHTWNPTVKTQVITVVRDEISPIQEVQSANFVIVKGIQVKPQWLVTDKITLGGDIEWNDWHYKGIVPAGATAPAGPAGDYTNRVATLGLNGLWKPTKAFTLLANYVHERRSSDIQGQDYTVDLFTIEGRISF
jgi:hypothetical protein